MHTHPVCVMISTLKGLYMQVTLLIIFDQILGFVEGGK